MNATIFTTYLVPDDKLYNLIKDHLGDRFIPLDKIPVGSVLKCMGFPAVFAIKDYTVYEIFDLLAFFNILFSL